MSTSTKFNRYDLIGGSTGIPATQILNDALGRPLQVGDRVTAQIQETVTFIITDLYRPQDPRLPEGTQVLEIASKLQLVIAPSPTGRQNLNNVLIVDRPATDDLTGDRLQAIRQSVKAVQAGKGTGVGEVVGDAEDGDSPA